jgi:hypothetical protein
MVKIYSDCKPIVEWLNKKVNHDYDSNTKLCKEKFRIKK